MRRHRTPEMLVKEALGAEPSPAERDAVWRSVLKRLDDEAVPHRPRRRRLLHPAMVGAAVLAVVLSVLAVLPAPERPVKPSPRPPEPSGEPAMGSPVEAVAVLNAAARSSRSALRAVGPGEYLFARTSTVVPGDEGGPSRSVTRSWTATSGSALIVERSRSRRACASDPSSECRPRWESSASTTRYRAGDDAGVIRTGDGREMPVRPDPFMWRQIVLGGDVVALPTEPEPLLHALRAGTERAVAKHRRRPDPHRRLGGRDVTLLNIELHGLDLAVVHNITRMLVDAPLSPDQRAAMLRLLADLPGWYRTGSSAEPLQVRGLGPARDALGRDGTAVQVGSADLVLDIDGGRLLEIRSFEHGRDARPITITVEEQRVAGSADGEARRPRA